MDEEHREELVWRLAQRGYAFGITPRNTEMEAKLQGGTEEQADGYLSEAEAALTAAYVRYVVLKGLECIERERAQTRAPGTGPFADFARERKRRQLEREKPGRSGGQIDSP